VLVLWLSLVPQSADGQTIEQADSFIRATYHRYGKSIPGPDILWEGALFVFTPSLVRLIRRDQGESGGIGKLDADPICSCQDWEGLEVKGLQISKSGDKEAVASVSIQLFANDPSTIRTLTLRLKWLPQGWRIDDVSSKEVPSLRKLLR
jgi:hypothetical protein